MKVFIDPESKQRLDMYVEAVPDEISGLGRVYAYKGNLFIENVYLLKQESSSTHTDLDPDAIADFIGQLIKDDQAPEEIKLWWHSHGNMGCFWSSTDEGTAQTFGNGWMLSLVLNKKGEYKCRLDVYEPVHLTCDDIVMEVAYPPASKELVDAIAAEVKEKVGRKTWIAPVAPMYGSPMYGSGYDRGGWKTPMGWEDDDDLKPIQSSRAGKEWVRDPQGNWIEREVDEEVQKFLQEAIREEEEEEWRMRLMEMQGF